MKRQCAKLMQGQFSKLYIDGAGLAFREDCHCFPFFHFALDEDPSKAVDPLALDTFL